MEKLNRPLLWEIARCLTVREIARLQEVSKSFLDAIRNASLSEGEKLGIDREDGKGYFFVISKGMPNIKIPELFSKIRENIPKVESFLNSPFDIESNIVHKEEVDWNIWMPLFKAKGVKINHESLEGNLLGFLMEDLSQDLRRRLLKQAVDLGLAFLCLVKYQYHLASEAHYVSFVHSLSNALNEIDFVGHSDWKAILNYLFRNVLTQTELNPLSTSKGLGRLFNDLKASESDPDSVLSSLFGDLNQWESENSLSKRKNNGYKISEDLEGFRLNSQLTREKVFQQAISNPYGFIANLRKRGRFAEDIDTYVPELVALISYIRSCMQEMPGYSLDEIPEFVWQHPLLRNFKDCVIPWYERES